MPGPRRPPSRSSDGWSRSVIRAACRLGALLTAALPFAVQAAYQPPSTSSSPGTGWVRVPGTLQDVLAVFGVAVALLVVLLPLAGLLRRRSRRHASVHKGTDLSEPGEPEPESGGHNRRRRKRRRRDHRSRNPTLAETGGLPPPRAGGDPES